MVSRRSALAMALALGLAPQVLSPTAQARTAPDPTTHDRLRFLGPALRLTVRVKVNDLGPYVFMIDTGANASVISNELAAELGLTANGRALLHGIAGSAMVDRVTIDSLKTTTREAKGLQLAMAPESRIGAHGLLGLDWLGESNLLIDYGRRRMVVGKSLPITEGQTVAVPVRMRRNGLALIDAVIPGVPLVTFIDSGSTTTVGNLALLEAARRRKAVVGRTLDMDLTSVTGQTLSCTAAVLSGVRIGDLWLHRLPVVMGPIHTFDYWGLNDTPALLIGADVLQRFQSVALDFRRGEVRFSISARG